MADTNQASQEEVEYSEDKIAVHWREEEYVEPPEAFQEQANAGDKAILERFKPENFPQCFEEYAEMLDWDKKWDEIVDTSNPPFFKWWVGGRLNACVNCVDRHLESRGEKNAIIWPTRWPSPTGSCTGGSTSLPPCSRSMSASSLRTGSRSTFPWCPSSPCQCWPVPVSA